MKYRPKSLMAKGMNACRQSSKNYPNWRTLAGEFVPWNR